MRACPEGKLSTSRSTLPVLVVICSKRCCWHWLWLTATRHDKKDKTKHRSRRDHNFAHLTIKPLNLSSSSSFSLKLFLGGLAAGLLRCFCCCYYICVARGSSSYGSSKARHGRESVDYVSHLDRRPLSCFVVLRE